VSDDMLMMQLRACARPGNLYQRALIRIMKLEGDCASYERTMQVIGSLPPEPCFGGIPLNDLACSGDYGWHPGDEA
jgi:hypothetical protein